MLGVTALATFIIIEVKEKMKTRKALPKFSKYIAALLAIILMASPLQATAAHNPAAPAGLYWETDSLSICMDTNYVDIDIRLVNTTHLAAPHGVTMALQLDRALSFASVLDISALGFTQVPGLPDGIISFALQGPLSANATETISLRLHVVGIPEAGDYATLTMSRPIVGGAPTVFTTATITRAVQTPTIHVAPCRTTTVELPLAWANTSYTITGDHPEDEGSIYVTFSSDVDAQDISVQVPDQDMWPYDITTDSRTGQVTVATVPPILTLGIFRAHPTEAVLPGDTITSNIVVTNTGNVPLTNVLVEDRLSPYTTFVSTTHGALIDDIIIHYIDTLDVDETFVMTTVVQVNYNAHAQSLLNPVASATIPGQDCNCYHVSFYVRNHDVTATIDTDQTVAILGETVTYELLVTNTTPVPLHNVTIAGLLPANLSFVSANRGNYGHGVLMYAVPTVPPGESVAITLVALVDTAAEVGDEVTTHLIVTIPGHNDMQDMAIVTYHTLQIPYSTIGVNVAADRAVTVNLPAVWQGLAYTIQGNTPGEEGDITVTFPAGVNPDKIAVTVPNTDWTHIIATDEDNGQISLTFTPPQTYTLTFVLYESNSAILDRFAGYTTAEVDGFRKIVVPINPGSPVDHPLMDRVRAFGNIYSQAGAPSTRGYAFWGWFDNCTLNDANRTNTDTGLRRPALGYTCQLTALLDQVAAASTPEALEALFDGDTNINLFAAWALWGDVLDNGQVCQLSMDALARFIALDGIPGMDIAINVTAANVVIDDRICLRDLNLLMEYVALHGIAEVVLGAQQ
jgi:uncharacterized repeat protein (TIGR01451 family)